jgi:hypothetical protein
MSAGCGMRTSNLNEARPLDLGQLRNIVPLAAKGNPKSPNGFGGDLGAVGDTKTRISELPEPFSCSSHVSARFRAFHVGSS